MTKEGNGRPATEAACKELDMFELAPHDFSRAQIVFRAKQPGRMNKF